MKLDLEGVAQVLWEDWDPLEMNQVNGWPDDEYNNYAPAVLRMLEEGATTEDLAQHLHAIETDFMNLDCRRLPYHAAHTLLKLKAS